jgi:four helix bundle protein
MPSRKYDLEDRLVNFGGRIVDVVDALPVTRAANYIAGQLIRCGLAPALLYAEAQAAEFLDDFIHKMKVTLKELKETRVCLKLIRVKQMINPVSRTDAIFKENEELVAIVATSIETAKKNKGKK